MEDLPDSRSAAILNLLSFTYVTVIEFKPLVLFDAVYGRGILKTSDPGDVPSFLTLSSGINAENDAPLEEVYKNCLHTMRTNLHVLNKPETSISIGGAVFVVDEYINGCGFEEDVIASSWVGAFNMPDALEYIISVPSYVAAAAVPVLL